MAKVLVDGLSAEIAALHEHFETNSTRELVRGEHTHDVRSFDAMSKNSRTKPSITAEWAGPGSWHRR